MRGEVTAKKKVRKEEEEGCVDCIDRRMENITRIEGVRKNDKGVEKGGLEGGNMGSRLRDEKI